MAACQVYRDDDDKITKVLAPNGNPSVLYKDLVTYVNKTGSAKLIGQLPYLQAALAEGSILGSSPEEVALGIWSIAYTDAYSSMFKGLTSMLPTAADPNGEPKVNTFLSGLNDPNSKFTSGPGSYVLTAERSKTVTNGIKRGNKLQQRIAEALVIRPQNPVILEPVNHIYMDAGGNEYLSTTTAIKGGLVDPENKYELNRKYGNAFDRILEGIINGEKLSTLATDPKVEILSENMKNQAFNTLSAFVQGITSDGSVIIPQVMLGDPTSRIAGSLDVLVIKPNGKIKIIDLKVSKNSKDDATYSNTKYDTHAGSKIGGQLTTKQQHGIQVSVYKKLVELEGFEVEEVETVHIKLELGEQKEIKSFVWEGTQSHSPMSNNKDASKVIPNKAAKPHRLKEFLKELGLDNPANSKDFLTQQESMPGEEVTGDLFDKIVAMSNAIISTMEARKKYFEKIKDNKAFQPRKETIMKVNELIVIMGDELRKDKPSAAYGAFLTHVDEEVTGLLNFITNPANKNNPKFAGILIEGSKFIESYRGLIKAQYFGSKDQQAKMIKVIDLLEGTRLSIEQNLTEHVQGLYQKNSNKNLTQEELDSILKEVLDISEADYYLGDIATSTNPLLATVDKIVKNAIQTSRDRTDIAVAEIRAAGMKLLRATGTKHAGHHFYDFMKVFTKDGKFTGRYVTKIGQQYWDLYYKYRNALKEKNGDTKQYIPIINVDPYDPQNVKDVEYNIELFKAKQANRKFHEAEESTPLGFIDGDHHKYTDEFKALRLRYERPEAWTDSNGRISWTWKRRETVTVAEHELFRAQNYKKVDYWGAVIEADGQFHGRVTFKQAEFPNNEHVEIKEVTSKGVDMRDPKYVKLMDPTVTRNAVEQAQSDFYKTWTKQMNITLAKLEPSVAKQMLGKIARYRGGFIENLKKNGEGFMTVIGKTMRNAFRADVYTDQRVLDEDGSISTGIPVTFVGKLQSKPRVAKLKADLKLLDESYATKKITKKEYLAEKKKLSHYLQIEEGKMSADEIEPDLVENLIAFRTMAENFEAMSDIENDIKAIGKVIENSTYVKEDALGRPLIKKGTRDANNPGEKITKPGYESNSNKRLEKYLKMVFYNDEEMNRTTMAMIAQRFQNLTSLKGIGFNIFGSVNNYVMGRINNSIEGWGGQHYTHKALHRANMAFNKDYLPGWFSKKGQMIATSIGQYETRKPGSKYEAMVEHFRIVRKHQADNGRIDAIGWAYMFQEGGEYNVQSKTGIAMLMSEELRNSKTGETESIYDAFTFNPNTGELTLKDGYELPDEQRHKTTNHIYEVNKLIHGNYQFEDRMVIQQHWLGQLAAQFHKWVYPAYKARLKGRYNDQNLGEIEGRYITVWHLIAYMRETEGNILEKIRGGFQGLDAAQVANMRKNLAELAFFSASFAMYGILTGLGKGVPDDDENLKKLMNFLTYQQSRQMQEIITMVPGFGIREQFQLVKNPIAIFGTAKDFGDVVYGLLKMPFPPYDKNYYDRGVYKGDLKLWKEFKDATPALNILNKWDSFEQVKSFYIK